jgi:ubiquinone/menaquinone biosynthesis C-methylase UbiE
MLRTRGGALMSQAEHQDVWASGDAYEPYVGRWSRLVATDFLNWLAIPTGWDWLDVGCGTGALTQTILKEAAPNRVLGVDPSAGFVAHAAAHVDDRRARFRVGDAQALPVSADEFDVTVSGLVINFVPDQRIAVTEMARATKPGGTVAAYVWDYAGEMQMMRRFWDAAVALAPAAKDLDEGIRFPVCHPEALQHLFRKAGLEQISTQAIDAPTTFKNFDDYWTPFLGGQAPAPGYCMSLSKNDRAALRERIRASLPIRDDGSIHLIARAWAVKGSVADDSHPA